MSRRFFVRWGSKEAGGIVARILVVDDEQPVRQVVRLMLESAGHDVAEAANGAIAVSMSSSCEFDLVLTDMYMPEQEGIETIPQLRSVAPRTKVVAMSGGGCLGRGSLLDMARKLGADATLAKPFGPDELVRCIETTLVGKPQIGSQ
jgi:CheY-like chemotaxis protein